MTREQVCSLLRPFPIEDSVHMSPDGKEAYGMILLAETYHNRSSGEAPKSLIGLAVGPDSCSVFPILGVVGRDHQPDSICLISGLRLSVATPARILRVGREMEEILSAGDSFFNERLLFNRQGELVRSSFEMVPPSCLESSREAFRWLVLSFSTRTAGDETLRQETICRALARTKNGEGDWQRARAG